MKRATITDGELLVLGLVAEMPRHGYELERVIEERHMREWTQIGFSSIYFVLGKLERRGLISARLSSGQLGSGEQASGGSAVPPPDSDGRSAPRRGGRQRKVYAATAAGREALVTRTVEALHTVRPTYSSVLLGMLHWAALTREESLAALEARGVALAEEAERMRALQLTQQPLPDHIEALFEHSLGQLEAEAAWVERTLAYMARKPWLP